MQQERWNEGQKAQELWEDKRSSEHNRGQLEGSAERKREGRKSKLENGKERVKSTVEFSSIYKSQNPVSIQ